MNCSGIGVATMTIERSNNGISFEIIKTIATNFWLIASNLLHVYWQ